MRGEMKMVCKVIGVILSMGVLFVVWYGLVWLCDRHAEKHPEDAFHVW